MYSHSFLTARTTTWRSTFASAAAAPPTPPTHPPPHWPCPPKHNTPTPKTKHPQAARPLPRAFASEVPPAGDHAGKAIVLAPIGPLAFVGRNGGGRGKGECPSLAVERHSAAQSVVARKMIARLAEDAAWLRGQV